MIASFDIGEVNIACAIGTADTVHKLMHWSVKEKKSRQPITDSCLEISKILNGIDFSLCNKVIIERQMATNTRALCIGQHVWTWFSVQHPQLNPEFVSASIKTKRGLSYSQRKREAIETVLTLLTVRNDKIHLDYLQSLKKKDDVADAYIQLVKYCTLKPKTKG